MEVIMQTRKYFQDDLLSQILIDITNFERVERVPGDLFLRDLADLIGNYLKLKSKKRKNKLELLHSPAARFFPLGVMFPIVCFSHTIEEVHFLLGRIRNNFGTT